MNTVIDASTDNPQRRLHPWSWLFVLAQQLRQYIVPILAVLIFGGRSGRGGNWDLLGPVIVIAVLVALSIWRYFTYHYQLATDRVVVRSGLLSRNRREIPFARIHNVVLHQTLLHRAFGVAEVRLESAGGLKPEAEMRVLGLHEALALENLIRHSGQLSAQLPAAAEADDRRPLLALSTAEVIRLGLISNRGMIVFAAALGVLWQSLPERLMASYIERYTRELLGYADHLHLGWISTAIGAITLLLFALAALRGLSVLLALTQYHGFQLSENQRRLTVERGLFTRLRTSVAHRRIQAWALHEGPLHRLFRRRNLRIDTAVSENGNDQRALKELAPIATTEACDALIIHLLPGLHWPPHWQPLPGGIWWRLWLPGAIAVAVLAILGTSFVSLWAWLLLLWLPWGLYAARQRARGLAFAIDERLIAVRSGWWSRYWRFAELDKLQALQLRQSIVDRYMGTATLWLDTAGASSLAPPLRIRFLPEEQAHELYLRLGRILAGRRMRW